MPTAPPAAVVWLLLIAALATAAPVHAQPTAVPPDDGHTHDGLILGEASVYKFVPPTLSAGKRAASASADLVVTYEGFTGEARAAFAYAVSIWEAHIAAAVPIRIDASFSPLDSDDDTRTTLGAAQATYVFANQSRFGFTETWYPAALAKAIQGVDLTAGGPGEADEADLVAFFNSDFDGWYFGLDGDPPAGQTDFVTVVLHEIGHGLGFAGSIRYDDGDAPDECPNGPEGSGCWGIGTQGFPYVYDRFTEDRSNVKLINTAVYPNPSILLGDVIQSGQVFFDSEGTRLVNLDVPVDLHAPSNFEPGSSYSHLDEEVFPPGTPNALMTPILNRNEAIHSPGAVGCAMFEAIGWPLGVGCIELLGGESTVQVLAFEAARSGTTADFEWQVTRPDAVERFELQARYFYGPFETLATVLAETTQGTYETTVTDLEPGEYTFRVLAITGDVQVESDTATISVPLPEVLVVQPPYPNPFTADATVDVLVRVRQDVSVNVYDAAGRRVAQLFEGPMASGELYRLRIDATGWPAGVYFVQAAGDEGYSQSHGLVLVR